MVKYVKATVDEDDGFSEVVVRNGKRYYHGYAQLHPDDDWSSIFGCRIAELRATLNALNDVIREKRKEYRCIQNFIKACECYKNFDVESNSARCVYRQLNRRKTEIDKLIQTREDIKKFIHDSIDMRESLKKKIKKMREIKE